MTDHLPSKDEKLLIELRGWHTLKGADCFRQAADEIETLRRKLNECGLECSSTLKSLVAENERLRTCLTGISTCSACEACRGAALLALGGTPPGYIEAINGLGIHGVWCSKCGSPLGDGHLVGCPNSRAAQPPPVARTPDWCPTCTKPYSECRCNGVGVG